MPASLTSTPSDSAISTFKTTTTKRTYFVPSHRSNESCVLLKPWTPWLPDISWFESSESLKHPIIFIVKTQDQEDTNILTMFQVWGRALWGVQSASPAPMFRVVVHKHVIRHSQNMTIHADCRRDYHLQDQTYWWLLICSTNPHLPPLPLIFPETMHGSLKAEILLFKF